MVLWCGKMASLGRYTTFVTNLYAGTAARYLSKKRGKAVLPWLKGDVLDIGCGQESSLADLLAKEQHDVGVDIQEDAIRKLKETKPQHEFYCIDVEKDGKLLETLRSQFDTIVLLAVVEHLRQPERLLNQCRALLKPEGHLLLTTPTSQGDKFIRTFKKLLGVKHEEQENYSPHLTNFTEKSLHNLLASQSEFKILAYKKFEFGFNQLVVASK